jgi:hypothetical protein
MKSWFSHISFWSLGILLATGFLGLPPSVHGQQSSEARSLLRAAEAGDSQAMLAVGLSFLEGSYGFTQNGRSGESWLRRSMEAGNDLAAILLGVSLITGDYSGLERDFASAYRVLRPVANRGIPAAQYLVGILYARGEMGVSQNFPEALRLWHLAAQQGHVESAEELSEAYAKDTRTPTNRELARFWKRQSDSNAYPLIEGDLQNHRGNNNRILELRTTGSLQGQVWGTGIYSDDSHVALAAVHAGVLKPGQTGTVRVRILPGRARYDGSIRNGVASQNWAEWDGSFEFVTEPALATRPAVTATPAPPRPPRAQTTPTQPTSRPSHTPLANVARGIPEPGKNWVSPTTGMEFIWIPALEMWVGRFEVTNAEYRLMKPDHDSGEHDGHSLNQPRQPVTRINFQDAMDYANWLMQNERREGNLPRELRVRLPTKYEFEAYAQVGQGWRYPWGNDWPPTSGRAGNYYGAEAPPRQGYRSDLADYNDGFPVSAPVEESWENPWGLFGVGGNVKEATLWYAQHQHFGGWRGASWEDDHMSFLMIDVSNTGGGAQFRNRSHGFRLIIVK